MESLTAPPDPTGQNPAGADLRVCVLGPLSLTRDGAAVALPASRKVQALLAYLALSPAPVTRGRLSTLLWDVANDPKGELRWCLTKLRAMLGRDRVIAVGDRLSLDLSDGCLDAVHVADAVKAGLDGLAPERLQTLIDLSAGDFMEGLELERCPAFNRWLTEQRERFRAHHAELGAALAARRSAIPATPCNHIPPTEAAAPRPHRASLAVMPFHEAEQAGPGGIAAGLTYDIIARLAKLRSFFVIAQGSVFALAEQKVDAAEAGRRLEVDYLADGTVRRRGDHLLVTVELIERRSARIVWSETFDRKLDDLFAVLEEIGDTIVAAIAAEIETAERNNAILKPPGSLNAWEAYHRGLWHMYRFTREENAAARHFFAQAIKLDPTFSRAYAGLSFTHWQSAFQRWEERERQCDLAYAMAGQSLIVDDRDPVAHWSMGRALWLRGRNDESVAELKSAVGLSPNFALGHYAVSFVESQSGDPYAAIAASDQSRHLSPFDPLMFGMLGTRALALVRLGAYDEAADWALKAAARPNAHVTIRAIAAHCLALADRVEEGRQLVAGIRKTLPDYSAGDFLDTFHFAPDAASLFREGARRIGLN